MSINYIVDYNCPLTNKEPRQNNASFFRHNFDSSYICQKTTEEICQNRMFDEMFNQGRCISGVDLQGFFELDTMLIQNSFSTNLTYKKIEIEK